MATSWIPMAKSPKSAAARAPAQPFIHNLASHVRAGRQLPADLAALGRRAAACGPALQPEPGWGMEDVCDCLAHRVLNSFQAVPSGRRFMVGIAGSPGAGKSTLAEQVVRRMNAQAGQEVAVQVPMDGFHLYRRQLDEMPNRAAAHARRGVHWTFDGAAYVAFLRLCREGKAVAAPSFDHGTGDPVENNIPVLAQHRIVVSEGNWVLLGESCARNAHLFALRILVVKTQPLPAASDMQPWCELANIFDDSWFLECDLDTAMDRVYARQISNGVPPYVSRARVAGNDRPNGELVQRTCDRAHLVVPNLPFRTAAPER